MSFRKPDIGYGDLKTALAGAGWLQAGGVYIIAKGKRKP